MSISFHHCSTDVESCLAIQEAPFDDKSSDEIYTRTEQPRQYASLFSTLKIRLRA